MTGWNNFFSIEHNPLSDSIPSLLLSSVVSQGTVLGAILFLIHINDMELIQDSSTISFADDTKISREIQLTEDTEILQSDLNNVIDWSPANNMELHEKKFESLRGRLQRTSGKWGGGWFWNFGHSRTGGGGWFVKVRTSENFWKNRNSKICHSSLKVKLEIIIDRDSNMRAFTYDVCSNLGVSK